MVLAVDVFLIMFIASVVLAVVVIVVASVVGVGIVSIVVECVDGQ